MSDSGLFKPLKGAQYEFPKFRMFPQKGQKFVVRHS
nr:MAG TPA: hypothetical protein [Caudoviricetes sp.]